MSGMIITSDPDSAQAIAADGWFPPVTLSSLRDRLRVGGATLTDAMLTEAIEGAMLTALRLLANWRSQRALAGAMCLADVTSDQVNGRNRAEMLWERAIRFHAAAELADGNVDITATDAGLDRASEKETIADTFRRLAGYAIADLLSIGGKRVGRIRVGLL